MSEINSIVEYRDLTAIGFPGYRAGSDGTIWTRWKTGSRPMRLAESWKIMKQFPQRDGYLFVTIGIGAVRKRMAVHRLILMAFHGPCPDGMQARHYPDRNPQNNHARNLSWSTLSENQADRVKHGTDCRGSKCYAAKLTEETVKAIRQEYEAGGTTMRKLAKKYGVSFCPIQRLIRRQSWANVQ